MKKLLLVLLIGIWLAPNAHSQETLDQAQPLGGSGGPASANWLAQTFTAGLSGTFSKAMVEVSEFNGGIPRQVYLLDGPTLATAVKVDSTMTTFTTGYSLQEITFNNVANIVSGNTYWLVINSNGNNLAYRRNTSNVYAGGYTSRLIGNFPTWTEFVLSGGNYDMVFQTFVFVDCVDRTLAVTRADSIVCPNDSTTVDLPITQPGVSYTLQLDSNNMAIGAPQPGNGGPISFSTGPVLGSTTYSVLAEQVINYGLEFDGVDDYVEFPFHADWVPSGEDMTWNFWLYMNDTANDQAILGYTDPSASGYEIMYSASRQAVEFRVRQSGSVLDTVRAPISGSTWTQITIIYDRNDTLSSFVNGVWQESRAATSGVSPTAPDTHFFGKDKRTAGNLQNLDGILDEFSFWTKSSTPAEIVSYGTTELVGNETDLIAYYRFNGNFGQNILTDDGIYGHDGDILNADSSTIWVNSPAVPPPACGQELFTTVEVSTEAQVSFVLDSAQHVTCNGDGDGFIAVSFSGGTGSLSKLWNTGDTTNSIFGLGGGNYTLTVTDQIGCENFFNHTIVDPATISLGTATVTDPLCFGDSGTVHVPVFGGTPFSNGSYAYTWSNGTNDSTLMDVGGSYSFSVTDSNGCPAAFGNYTITEPALLTANDTNLVMPDCNGDANGSINLNTSGGTPGYSYNWSSGDTTSMAINLAAGTYTYTVTDANGCTYVDVTTLTEPAAITALPTTSDALCFGASTGTASLATSGGTGTLVEDWGVQNPAGLPAGTHVYTVTDDNACQLIDSVTISEPTAVGSTVSGTQITCNGLSDGTGNVTPSGGTPGYSFMWSSGDTTANVAGLMAGTYTVLITDANSCTLQDTLVLTEPTLLVATVSGATSVPCFGDSATANSTVVGGTPGYGYSWSHGPTTATVMDLTAGTYYLQVTDTNGCISTDSITVTEPSLLDMFLNATDLTCNGDSSGFASVMPSGGTTGYSFNWSNGDTISNLSGLQAGTYTLVMTDGNGCVDIDSITVNEPAALTASVSGTDALCNGDSTGTAMAAPGGGTPGYSYMWSNSATTANISGLVPGTYTVTVTDTNGCSLQDSVAIAEPTALSVAMTGTDLLCNGDASGTATGAPAGGTPGYMYMWSNADTTSTTNGLMPGTYYLTVTDTNGCSTMDSVVINEPPVLSATATGTDEMLGNDGTTDLTVTGGTPGYTFDWDNDGTGDNDDMEDLTGLAAGTYTVIVIDANGCADTVTVDIGSQVGITTQEEINLNVYPNPNNGQFVLSLHNNGQAEVELLTIEGRRVEQRITMGNSKTYFDHSELAKGLYLVRVKQAGHVKTVRVNIQ